MAGYREGGSFTHDGKKYNLNKALEIADNKRVRNMSVNRLKWVLKYDKPNKRRLKAADISAPLLVAPDKRGRPTVVDGLHRLAKANATGVSRLPVRYLSKSDMTKLSQERSILMNVHKYLEKRAASIKELQTAYTKTVKPFAKKGMKDRMLRRIGDKSGGTIILSGEGMGGKSTPKLHRASNLMTGLHEGSERSSEMIHKGFMGHNAPTIGLQDYLRINTLKGYTPAEKKVLREGLPDKSGALNDYGAQRRAEAKILGQILPEYKATFGALVAGKTHKPDGTRLLNKNERKKINKAYRKFHKNRMQSDVEGIAAEKNQYSELEGRLRRLLTRKSMDLDYTGPDKMKRMAKRRKAMKLWDRIEERHRKKIEDLSGKPATDFRELLIKLR